MRAPITCRCGHTWQPHDVWDVDFCPQCGERTAASKFGAIRAEKPTTGPRRRFERDYDEDDRPRPRTSGKWYTSTVFIVLLIVGVVGAAVAGLVGVGIWAGQRAAARRAATWAPKPPTLGAGEYYEDFVRR